MLARHAYVGMYVNPRIHLQEQEYLAAQEKEAIRELLNDLTEQELVNIRRVLRDWPDTIAA